MKDVMTAAFVDITQRDLLDTCYQSGDFTHVSLDGTQRILRRGKGQEEHNAPASAWQDTAVPEQDALRRVLTLVGLSGVCLGMSLIKDESHSEIARVLTTGATWTTSQRAQVVSVCCDQTSSALFDGLRGVLPQLRFLSLDPVHPTIVCEHAHYRKKTPGSRDIRRLLVKFSKYDDSVAPEQWGAQFTGCESMRSTTTALRYRNMLLDASMPHANAVRILASIDSEIPWMNADSFTQAMAALSIAHSQELGRRAHVAGQTLQKLLWNAVSTERVQWYLKNLRALHALPRQMSTLLGSGTSTNQALHRDLPRLDVCVGVIIRRNN